MYICTPCTHLHGADNDFEVDVLHEGCEELQQRLQVRQDVRARLKRLQVTVDLSQCPDASLRVRKESQGGQRM